MMNMKTRNDYCAAVPADELRYLEMTFTTSGLAILQAYRDALTDCSGRRVTLGMALNNFLHTHGFADLVLVEDDKCVEQ